ncbi:hypothetical protein RJ639_014599, partial [Escallonia herrerae]
YKIFSNRCKAGSSQCLNLLSQRISFSCKFNFSYIPCFVNYFALDEMGSRITELEQSINDLRTEMGAEGSPSPLAPSKKPDDATPEEGSA